MAYLVACSNGSILSSGTWRLAAVYSNSWDLLMNIGTSWYNHADTFSYSGTVDAVGIFVYYKRASSAATVTVSIYNETTQQEVAQSTVNVSALPLHGLVSILLPSPVTLTSSNQYRFRVRCSASGHLNLMGAWTRPHFFLRTTSSQAPTSADSLYICGEINPSDSSLTSFSVTMDNTDENFTVGSGISSGNSFCLVVSSGCSLNYSTQENFQPTLKINGCMIVCGGGSLNIGTSSSPIPASSRASLRFHMPSNWYDVRLHVSLGGTLRAYGSPLKTAVTYLTQTLPSGQATMQVSDASGWASGDIVLITNNTLADWWYNSNELRTINSINGNQVTLLTNVSYTHDGGSDPEFKSYAVNLSSKNIRIVPEYSDFLNSGNERLPMMYIGTNFSYNPDGMSFAQAEKSGPNVYASHAFIAARTDRTNSDGSELSNCIFYGNPFAYSHSYTTGDYYGRTRVSFSSCVFILNDNWSMRSYFNQHVEFSSCFLLKRFGNCSANFSVSGLKKLENCVIVGCTVAIDFDYEGLIPSGFSVSGNTFIGCNMNLTRSWRIRQCKFYLSNTYAISSVDWAMAIDYDSGEVLNPYKQPQVPVRLEECDFCGVRSILGYNGVNPHCGVGFEFIDCTFRHHPYQQVQNVVRVWNQKNYFPVRFVRLKPNPSSPNDRIQSHPVQFENPPTACVNIFFEKCHGNIFPSGALSYGSLTSLMQQTYFGSSHTPGGKITFAACEGHTDRATVTVGAGAVVLDTQIVVSVSQFSERLVPRAGRIPMQTDPKYIPVPAGQQLTVSCYVRKSTASDGEAFNGTYVSLVLLQDPSIGVDQESAVSSSAGNGTWDRLELTLPSSSSMNVVYTVAVRCNGTQGWVNVDGWEVS